jgi:hypothetical protein
MSPRTLILAAVPYRSRGGLRGQGARGARRLRALRALHRGLRSGRACVALLVRVERPMTTEPLPRCPCCGYTFLPASPLCDYCVTVGHPHPCQPVPAEVDG